MQAIKFSSAMFKKSIFIVMSCMLLANSPAFAQSGGGGHGHNCHEVQVGVDANGHPIFETICG